MFSALKNLANCDGTPESKRAAKGALWILEGKDEQQRISSGKSEHIEILSLNLTNGDPHFHSAKPHCNDQCITLNYDTFNITVSIHNFASIQILRSKVKRNSKKAIS